MKKTILSILIVAVLVAVMVTATACKTDSGLFRINEERASKQVTAVAEYEGRVGIVEVNDVYASFQNYYNYLYYYYQHGLIDATTFQSYMSDLDEILANSNESLGRTALYTLKCLDYLTQHYSNPTTNTDAAKLAALKAASTVGHTYEWKKMDELARYYAERNAEMEAVLACYKDYSYVNAAIRATNESIQELYDDYLSDVKAEANPETVKGDTTPSGYTDIRIVSYPIRLVYEVSSTTATLDTTGLKVVALYPVGTTFDEDIVVEDYQEGEGDNAVSYKAVEIPVSFLTIKDYSSGEAKDFSTTSAVDAMTLTVTYGKYSKEFEKPISVVAAWPTRTARPADEEEEEAENNDEKVARFVFSVAESDYVKDGMTEEERAEALKEYKYARTAMNRLNNYLSDNYRTYDNYLYSNLATQIRNAASDLITATVEITEAQLNEEYARLINAAYEGYLSTPYSKTTLDDRNTIVHKVFTDDNGDPTYGYYYVSQVLFKYTDDLSKLISDFNGEKTASEEALAAYSSKLAHDIQVRYSNPDYDADATCDNEDCQCPHCKNYKGERVEFTTLDQWYSCDYCSTCEEGSECKACPSQKYLSLDTVDVDDVIADIYEDLDAANDDFDLLHFLNVINGWSYMANEDDGVFDYIKNEKYGYLMTPVGVDSGMVASFEKACDTLAEYDGAVIPNDVRAELEQEGVYIPEGGKGGVGGYAYCVSTYGIHLVTLTYYVPNQPVDGLVNEGRVVDGDKYVELTLDYVTNVYDYEEVTEGNEYKIRKADGSTYYLAKGTLAASIYDSLYSEAVSTATGNFQKEFYNRYADSNVEYNAKGYEYLLKQLKGDD